MSQTVSDIIKSLKDNDTVAAQKAFNASMKDKMSAALDAEKIKVASTMVSKPAEEPMVEEPEMQDGEESIEEPVADETSEEE